VLIPVGRTLGILSGPLRVGRIVLNNRNGFSHPLIVRDHLQGTPAPQKSTAPSLKYAPQNAPRIFYGPQRRWPWEMAMGRAPSLPRNGSFNLGALNSLLESKGVFGPMPQDEKLKNLCEKYKEPGGVGVPSPGLPIGPERGGRGSGGRRQGEERGAAGSRGWSGWGQKGGRLASQRLG
jgi:hypothetical protein